MTGAVLKASQPLGREALAWRQRPHLPPAGRERELGPGSQGPRRASGADRDLRSHLMITAL